MTWNEWQDVISPKIQGAKNLHFAIEKEEQRLDFFFLASSIISVMEATGQANYLAANAAIEAFCRYRHGLGLPASVLNICPVEDVGFVAENENAALNVQTQGLRAVGEQEFLQCIELSLLQAQASSALPTHPTGTSSALPSWISPNQYIMGLHPARDLSDPKSRIMWRRDRRLGAYHNDRSQICSAPEESKRDELQTFLATLTVTTSADLLKSQVAIDLFVAEIGGKINEYLMRPEDKVDERTVLSDLGLDSLLSVELARWFQKAFGVRMGVLEIVSSGTLSRLARLTAKKLAIKHGKPTANGHR